MGYAPLEGADVQSRTIGVQASIKKLRRLREQGGKGAELGVFKATEFNKRESVKVTPKDKGDLRKSARTHYTGSGYEKKGLITFNTLYAVYVHEDLSKWHASGTYAKYLQRPVWENRAITSAMIRDEISYAQRG